MNPDFSVPHIAILGGGPGGYEAASVAASLGARVTIVERSGLGGSAVLTDVVPSKTLIATAGLMGDIAESGSLGIRLDDGDTEEASTSTGGRIRADLGAINTRILELANAQATDIYEGLVRAGVKAIKGQARLIGPRQVEVVESSGTTYALEEIGRAHV